MSKPTTQQHVAELPELSIVHDLSKSSRSVSSSESFEPYVQSESFDSSWQDSPGTLRRYGRRLGFLRLWQIYFISVVALNVGALLFLSHGQIVFGFVDYLGFIDAVFSGVAAWLIMRRKRVARPFVCVCSLMIFTASAVDTLLLLQREFSPLIFLGHLRVTPLLVAIYFFVSRRVRTALTSPFDFSVDKPSASTDATLHRPHDISFWRDLAMFFMVFAVVGHWMERAYGLFLFHVTGTYDPTAPLWQDFLSPFNIYGVGAVVCILLLFTLKCFLERKLQNFWLVLLVSYIANTLACTLIELIAGLLTNYPDASGHLIYWDYSNLPFNFMGQICLQNALCFGLVATLMVWNVYPAIEGLIRRCSQDTINVVFVVILIVYLLLSAFYLVNLTVLASGGIAVHFF
jgi:uncharacterized membrane protein